MKNFLVKINPFNNVEVGNRWLFLIKTILKFLVVYLINSLFAMLVVFTIKFLMTKSDFLSSHLNDERIKLIAYYTYLISIILTILFVKIFDKQPYSTLGLTKKWWQFIYGAIIAFVVVFAIVLVLVVTKQLKFNGLNPKWAPFKGILFLGAFIVYAIAEEMLCRGVIENRIRKRFNLHICVFVSFLAFCVPHVVELLSEIFSHKAKYALINLANLLLISYCFSLFLDAYDNIYVCSGFHTAWNFSFYSIMGSVINGIKSETSIFSFTFKDSVLSGGAEGVESGLIATCVLAVLCIILTISVKIKEKKEHALLHSKIEH